MADFSALKTSIQNYIKQNGNEEITGNLLQQVLLSMVTTLGDSAINDLVTALNAEISNRGNADTELGGRINTLQGIVNGIKTNVENGYVYAGIATPSTTPASGKVFYLALTAGTYTNFGNTVVSQGINILKYNGSAWSLDSFLGLDNVPTQGSNNLVKSGGVLDSIIKDGSAFDLSAYNNGTTYADLNAALTALNALPAAYKKGGMSMKFVHTSDNKYIQYWYFGTEITGNPNPFLNTDNWLRTDNIPTVNAVRNSLIHVSGKVGIIGDSISTYNGTMPNGYRNYYPTGDVNSVYDMWWNLILSLSGSKLDVNASWSGSRVTNGRAGDGYPDFYDRTNLFNNPDYIFVALGTNDSAVGVDFGNYDYDSAISELSESEFLPAYIKGVKSLKENYPNAKIVLFICQMQESYACAIKNIGKHYNLDVIDVRNYYIGDNHPDKKGMALIAKDIFSFYAKEKVDEVPTSGSDNLVKSGGVETKFEQLGNEVANGLYDKEYSTPFNLTEISGTLRYDANTNKIVEGASGHNICYKQFSEDTIVRVQGTFSLTKRVFMVGTTEVLPADGVPVKNPYVLLATSATVDKEIFVPAGEYLCLYYYYHTWSDAIYQIVTYLSKFEKLGTDINLLDKDIDSLHELYGVIFDGDITFTGSNQKVKTFDITAGKKYTFQLNQDSFSGTAYFGIRDKDGNTLQRTIAITSMPFTYIYDAAQNYEDAYIIMTKSGTNTFSLAITVDDSILEKLNELEENADENTSEIQSLESDILELSTTGKETPVSYIQSSDALQYDSTTQKIVTSDNTSRRALYRFFGIDELVAVEGTITNVSKELYICKTTQIPANNISVIDVITVNTATFSKAVKVQAGEYLCVLVNTSYHQNISMKVMEQLKPVVLLNEKNSAPINQYDGSIVDITYNAAYYHSYPGNTYGNFLASIQAGFGGLKADMRLTSDGKVVLCHDEGYKLDSNGDIINYNSQEYESIIEIHNKTFAEIMALKFAQQVGGQDIHPCSLDDMLYLCKRYKSIPYLTLRDEQWVSDTIDSMYYLLQKYGLVSKVIINLFPATEPICSLLKAKDKSLIICNTRGNADLSEASIDDTYNLGCQIACYQKETYNSQPEELLIDKLTPHMIEYAASKGIRLWAWHNTTEQSITDHIKAGIVGFQNYSFVPINDIQNSNQ